MSSVFNLPGWAHAIAGNFYSGAVETLTGTRVIVAADSMILSMDPGGSARDVTLPAEATVAPSGQMFWIVNHANAAENLVIKDDAGNTIGTASQDESAVVYNSGMDGETESSWVLICLPQIKLA
tara:strand:- start:887 stop:1258 length:372 start_codon:yes stop_codon:yes gene_type:complete